jgi:pimeloyl-ACP methyl ester carboxylesterase
MRFSPQAFLSALTPAIASLSLALAASACSGDADPATAPGPTNPTPTERPQVAPPDASARDASPNVKPIEFAPCSFETGGTDKSAECANVEVPLDWSKPEGRKLTYFVKRVRGKSPARHRQLWLLQGGPGSAGDGLEPVAAKELENDPALDVYLPDHRGTGRSAYLDCPKAVARRPFDYAACSAEVVAEWGKDGLASFSTTAAARDVGHVIERTRTEGQEVHVYGVSYGTYLAQRYLQLFPTQPTAVTLDSVCQAGLCSYAKIGYWFDQVGKKYLGECAADAFCASKLGSDPVAKVREALTKADARTCSGIFQLDARMLRQVFSYFIASVQLRVLIPAMTYRILRCDSDDITALGNVMSVLSKMFGGGFDSFSPADGNLQSTVLGLNIAFSEMEEDPMLTRPQMAALMSDSVFSEVDPALRDAYDAWPKYERDEWVGKYSTTKVPVLLMNGTLDPQTPIEFATQIAPHYTQPGQTLVVFPRAAHMTVSSTPTGNDPSSPPCGLTVFHQFSKSPSGPLDTSCMSKMLGFDFDGSEDIAQYFFARPTLWGGPSSGAPGLRGPGGRAPNAPAPLSPQSSAAIRSEMLRAARVARPWAL